LRKRKHALSIQFSMLARREHGTQNSFFSSSVLFVSAHRCT